MKVFDYSILTDRTWDNEIVSYLTQIHEYNVPRHPTESKELLPPMPD